MKINMTVLTDSYGRILGAVRSDTVTVGKTTIQPIFRARHDQLQHDVQVEEAKVKGRPIRELEDHLAMLIKK